MSRDVAKLFYPGIDQLRLHHPDQLPGRDQMYATVSRELEHLHKALHQASSDEHKVHLEDKVVRFETSLVKDEVFKDMNHTLISTARAIQQRPLTRSAERGFERER